MPCSTAIVYALNGIFVVLGALVVGLASWGIKHVDTLSDAFDKAEVSVHIAVTVGVVLMVVGFLGCVGNKLREHKFGRFILCLYATLMLLLIVLELVAAVFILAATGNLNNPKSLKNQVDKWLAQEEVECCGSATPTDKCITKTVDINGSEDWCAEGFQSELRSWMNSHLKPVGIVLFVLAMIQIILVFASCGACCHGRRTAKAKKAAAAATSEGYYRADDLERGGAPQRQPQVGGAIRY